MQIDSKSLQDNKTNTLLAVVNYSAVGTWLEPYIGLTVNVIKKGVKKTWFEINYGETKKCKVDSNMFNYS